MPREKSTNRDAIRQGTGPLTEDPFIALSRAATDTIVAISRQNMKLWASIFEAANPNSIGDHLGDRRPIKRPSQLDRITPDFFAERPNQSAIQSRRFLTGPAKAKRRASPYSAPQRRSWYRKPVPSPMETIMKFWGVDQSFPLAPIGSIPGASLAAWPSHIAPGPAASLAPWYSLLAQCNPFAQACLSPQASGLAVWSMSPFMMPGQTQNPMMFPPWALAATSWTSILRAAAALNSSQISSQLGTFTLPGSVFANSPTPFPMPISMPWLAGLYGQTVTLFSGPGPKRAATGCNTRYDAKPPRPSTHNRTRSKSQPASLPDPFSFWQASSAKPQGHGLPAVKPMSMPQTNRETTPRATPPSTQSKPMAVALPPLAEASINLMQAYAIFAGTLLSTQKRDH